MNFGFSLSPSSAVNLDKIDLSLYHKMEEIEPDVRICIGCGSCETRCPFGVHIVERMAKARELFG